MEIKFVIPSVQYNIETILEFQKDEQSNFWSEPL